MGVRQCLYPVRKLPLNADWTSQDSVDIPAPFSSHLKFCWAYAAQMTVAPRLIVEGVNVVGNISRSLVSVFVDPFFDAFFFQTAEEGFRNRVVPTVSPSAHAGL